MLVLSRKIHQQIQIGPDITITVVRLKNNQVRLGIDAPESLIISRPEATNTAARSGSSPSRLLGSRDGA